MARTRSFDERTYDEGTTAKWISTYWYVVKNIWRPGHLGTCTDEEVGFGKDNAFLVDKSWYEYATLDGIRYLGTTPIRDVRHYATSGEIAARPPNAEWKAPAENWSALALDAVAAMNPQRPAINLPAVLGESGDIPGMLADLPRLLHGKGRDLLASAGRKARSRPRGLSTKVSDVLAAARQAASEAGSQYVGAQFGWRPLVQDLCTMLGLQASIAQQLGWLLRLKQGRSVKRRYRLPTTSVALNIPERTVESLQFIVKARETDVYRITRWITSRWAPTPLFTDALIPDLSDAQGLVGLATRLSTGMTRMGLMQASWELLPWSWLVDWWGNLGQQFAALGNSLFLQLESLCYMRTSKVTCYYAYSVMPDWLTPSEATILRRIILRRVNLLPYLAAGMSSFSSSPLALSGRQSAILGGLLAQYQSKGLRRL